MMRSGKRLQVQHGFTLIEIMIVIVIVSILIAIALPAYRDQIIRGKRAAAKGEMMDIANREQQLLLANRAYVDTTGMLATGYSLPADVADNYTFAISAPTVTPPTFLITFTPIGKQAVDGPPSLTLDHEGEKLPVDKWKR